MSEKELIAAVINQAWFDANLPQYKMPKNEHQREANYIREHATAWILAKTTRECSLSWYCDLIGMDPVAIRERLKGND